MRRTTHRKAPTGFGPSTWGLSLAGLILLGALGCASRHQPTVTTEPVLDAGWPKPDAPFTPVAYQAVKAEAPTVAGAEYVNDDELCANCHGAYAKSFTGGNVHRGEGCEGCHGPASKHVETRGKEPGLIVSFKTGPHANGAALAEACLKCHEPSACSEGAQWRTSKHAQCGVTCVSCHRGHHEVPPGTPATTEPGQAMTAPKTRATLASYSAAAEDGRKRPANAATLPSLRGTSNHLGAIAPGICFSCHQDKTDLARVAGPHQIGGPNGFNCTTCHDPHGHVKESSRRDLCLECHKQGSPTMAWHSSTHDLHGVACTDCHNPHPNSHVKRLAAMSHYQVSHVKRLPMSVQEPEACFKCHPKIFALTSLPSHHPIKEGKMVCSSCHDPHGQTNVNLKAEGVNNVNQLCYKCHAEKQGPFAYPHPPVDENCSICHEPHGTVANNLLRQPANFLCLRCHVGHRQTLHGHQATSHDSTAGNINAANNNIPSLRADIDRNPALRTAFYTDCTRCHAQIHGSNLPTVHAPGALMR